jgi:hypothetical protein
MSPEIAARFAALEEFMRRSIGTMVGIAHVRIRQHAQRIRESHVYPSALAGEALELLRFDPVL